MPAEQRCPYRVAPPSLSRPPATTAAAATAARATTAAGGGAAGSAGGAAAQPHRAALLLLVVLLLLVLLPLQVEVRVGVMEVMPMLEQLGVDSSGHCLSQTTPPLSSFQCVPGRVEVLALGSSESAVAPGAGESAAALGARESAGALGASASTATGPASPGALHTFTLDSGASRCFFRDCTTVTPLAAPVPVSLADPTGVPSVAICKCSRTVRHLATFTRQPGSSLYTPTTASAQMTESSQVAVSSWVSASGQLATSYSCRVLSHQTLLWHHRLGHPSLLRLCSMNSHLLVFGLPRSLPSLPRLPAPPCLPCVEGWQRTAPHSSEFPPTTTPLQTLHMDVWGPAPVGGMDQERYFLLVVDDYTRYTTVFPLRCKADVSGVLIPWIRATRRQLHERFCRDFPVLRLHSDRGGEFSSDLLAELRRDEGIVHSFTLPASPQQNGIVERRIGLIMEVARTSMIHVAASHFLWPFVVRYAAHQLNLWPRVSEPETSPTIRWTGKVGDASEFQVWGALSLVHDAKASKLSSCTLRYVFLGFPTNAPPWQFYHPRERQVFSSQDVTFDESVCYYRLHPHASHPVDPPPFVEPLEISSDSSSPAKGGDPATDDTAATRRSPRLETPPGFPPRPSSLPPQPAAVDSGAETAGAEPGGVETEGEGSGGAATRGVAIGGADSGGVATGGADSGGPASPSGGGAVGDPAGGSPSGGGYGPAGAGTASPGGTAGVGGTRGTAGGAGGAAGVGGTRGAAGAGGAGATSPRGAGATSPRAGAGGAGGAAGAGGAGAGGTEGAGAAGPGGARTGGAGAAGAGGVVSAGGAGGTGAAGTGGAGATGAGAGGAASAGGATGVAGTGGAGAAGTGGAGAAGTGGARTRAGGIGGTGGAGAAGPRGARTRGAGAAGAGGAAGIGGARGTNGARGAGANGARGAAGAGGATRAAGAGGAGAARAGGAGAAENRHALRARGGKKKRRAPRGARQTGQQRKQSQPQLLPGSPLPAPAPHTEVTESLTERREPETCASTPVRAPRVTRPRPPAVPVTHGMTLRPSSVPQRVVLPEPPASSLPHIPDPEFDLARAASPTVTRLLASVVTDHDVESTAAFALVTELVDFATRSCLDYVASLVTESESVYPPFVGGERALSNPDALDIPTPRSYAEAIAGEYSSHWQTAMDAEMASWKSTGTYVDEVPPPWANIVDGMWIFRVKRLPASLPAFKARYVARGFSQRQGVAFFQTFSPTPKMTTLRVLLHIAAQRDYELHSLDFSTAFLQGSIHEEIWLRRPPGFTGSFPVGTQWSLWRPVYGLLQAPREWHDTLRTTLAALGFAPSSADPSLSLRTDTNLSPFYVLVYVDDLVFATADTEALALVKAELQERQSTAHHHPDSVTHGAPGPSVLRLPVLLATAHSSVYQPLALTSTFGQVRRAKCTSGMGLVLEGQGSVVLTGHSDASWADDQTTQRSSQGYTFSLRSGSVLWRSTRSSSVLGSSCEAEIYAGAMAA
ncbi:unnamed protein product [Closterium sp. NIES-54]